MKDEVLLEVKIDPGVTEDKINKITNSLTFLTAETKDLIEINKTLEKDGQKLTSQYVENTKQIEINKNEISKQTSERKVLVQALSLENNSLGAVKASTKELMKEREGLNLSTREGKDRLIEINKQLSENKEVTDKVTSAGRGWKDSIDSVVPGFKGMVDGIEAGTKSALKFIATPLGATLALIVGAFALVSQWFTRTEAGGDALAKGMAQLEAIFGVVMDRAAALGGALSKLFTGDILGAFADAKEAVSGVTDEMAREAKEAGNLADILDALEDSERNYAVAASESRVQIKELMLQAKNRGLTEVEKQKLLTQAFELEVKQNAERKKIDDQILNAGIRKIRMTAEGAKMTQLAGETELEFAKRIIENDKIQGDARQELADVIISYNETQGESIALQEKINNQIDANILKQEEKKKKLEELKAKEQEEHDKELVRLQQLIDKQREADEKILTGVLNRLKNQSDGYEMLTEEQIKAIDELAKEEQEASNESYKTYKTNEEKKREEVKKTTENFVKALNATLDVTSDISSKITEIKMMQYKNESDALVLKEREELAALQRKFDDGLISEEEYNKEKKLIEKKFDEEQREVKRKAFEANKKNQIVQSTIDAVQSALAAFRSLVGVPFVGPALAATAAAAALAFGYKKVEEIKKSQFVGDEGGKVPTGARFVTLGGQYHNGSKTRGTQFYGSDGTRFLAEKDEGLFILKRNAHADFIRNMSIQNQRFGGRSWIGANDSGYHALGGAISMATQTGSGGGVSVTQLVEAVEAAVRAMPPPRVLVDDINTAQGNKIEVEAKSILTQ